MRDRERPKFYAKDVINQTRAKGFSQFGIYQHTQRWKQLDARDEAKGFGVRVGVSWFWYDTWIKAVEKYCEEHKNEMQ